MNSKAMNVAVFIYIVREQNMRLKKNAEKTPNILNSRKL